MKKLKSFHFKEYFVYLYCDYRETFKYPPIERLLPFQKQEGSDHLCWEIKVSSKTSEILLSKKPQGSEDFVFGK